MRKFVFRLLALLLAALMCYSAYRLWDINRDYRAEADMHRMVLDYKPPPQEDQSVVNQSVIDLQAKYPDVAGWLTVPGTEIDYPFVWYEDNDFYLRRDLNGDYALAGTLFMDFRCARDFTAQNTIIYGHHMRNGSMFGTLKHFADRAFFDERRSGTIFLPEATLRLEFFAFLVVDHADEEIYSVWRNDSYLDYVRRQARQYREIGLTDEDKIVTLSTCAYEFDNARMVLLARVR